jgi:hypothetical protein
MSQLCMQGRLRVLELPLAENIQDRHFDATQPSKSNESQPYLGIIILLY